MKDISTLNKSCPIEAILYKDKNDDGLLVRYNHGRMDWYRVDTREAVDISNYAFWK